MSNPRFYSENLYHSHSSSYPLKPMSVVPSTASLPSSTHYDTYAPIPTPHDFHTQDLEREDSTLKHRIRILKLISRLVATIISAVTLGLMIATITKFLLTKDVYFEVNEKKRTAWAGGTIVWYTYLYASIALASFLFNSITMVFYLCHKSNRIRAANRADTVSTVWSTLILVSHIVVWAVSAGIYRYGKEPVNGKFKDLWGWTCSQDAQALQEVLTSVDFERYCGVQSSAWYSGLANVGTGILSLVIWFLAIRRRSSKRRVGKAKSFNKIAPGSDMEPLRQQWQY